MTNRSLPGDLSRRALFGRLAKLAAGSVLAGCAPARVVLNWYPAEFESRTVIEAVLRSFVLTVIPGAPETAPDLTRVFRDPYFPFARRTGFFAADLTRRAQALFGGARFEDLPQAERTEVVANGLAADSITRRLYHGAILLAQVSFFAGIYDDDQGCELIGFEGSFRVRAPAELTYAEPDRFLTRCVTIDGNAA